MTGQEVQDFLNALGAPNLGPGRIPLTSGQDTIYILGSGEVEYPNGNIIGSLFDNNCRYGRPIERTLYVGGYQFGSIAYVHN